MEKKSSLCALHRYALQAGAHDILVKWEACDRGYKTCDHVVMKETRDRDASQLRARLCSSLPEWV